MIHWGAMKIRPKEFEEEIARSMERLPGFLKDSMQESGVAVLTEDSAPSRPGEEDSGPLFAEFIGPTSAQFESGESPFPPTMVLYRATFEDACATWADAREEIYRTLVHELGHFLGFEEEDLEDV